ncbi:MAG: AmmeMemoRadiSam system radical SAM enzyme [Spirochaetota bacterium]|nr:AmmeMemoRadiSam system radical SAM enzyme [Spirochaetota bacterium]
MPQSALKSHQEAMYYEKLEDNKVKCHLCPFECRVKEGKTARCMGRENIGGTFYATNYGETTSYAMDPIEKKPLFHFYPKSQILSIAANSCNLKCIFCQNWSISQIKTHTTKITPESVVQSAIDNKSIGVAYTYSEPLMWYEFVLDTAKLIRKAGLKNVLVTNGTINEKPLQSLLPYIDALNVDLKGINEQFYKKVCKSLLKPVLRNIKIIHDMKTPLMELTNLIIPTLNDSEDDLSNLINWIANLDPNIPLHFSAYHPSHKLSISQTPISTLKKAYDMAIKKLNYVYVGNASIEGTSNTYCPKCHFTLVTRDWYFTSITGLKDDHCKNCNEKINIKINKICP